MKHRHSRPGVDSFSTTFSTPPKRVILRRSDKDRQKDLNANFNHPHFRSEHDLNANAL
jgi:hypothetical protein